MKLLFTLTMLFQITVFSFAQTTNTCVCCTEKHQAFDFWIGEWNVTDTSGKNLGTNTITKIQNGCALEENWSSGTNFTGTSYNYYNTSDSTWNQLWIDNQGSQLNLKGKAKKNKMVLRGEPQKNQKGYWYYHQITWTLNDDKTVTQRWDMILQEGNSLMGTLFYGIYTKK